MQLLYFGSGAFGLPTLQFLHEHHDVLAVISQPDKPAGRKRVLTPTPIAEWALANKLPVLRVDNVNTPEFVQRIRGYNTDASIVIAFGQKLGPELIDAMGELAVNLHASLLPKYRGAAPINWAMIQGERETGVSVIGLAQRMDAGAVYATAATPIDPHETAGELHDRLALLGPGALGVVLDQLAAGTLGPVTQDEAQATKAPKFSKADGTVGFDQPAQAVRARVHGLTPWPGCRVRWQAAGGGDRPVLTIKRVRDLPGEATRLPPGTVTEGLRVACAAGMIELLELQAPGGKPMPADPFSRGHGLAAGDLLSPLVDKG